VSDELVLSVPRAVLEACGPFHGFTADTARYLPRLLGPAALRFLPRRQAEDDPSFKQLIPYVVLRCGGLVFHYRRGRAGTEARLRALRSIGVGGHVCADDGDAATAYRAGLLRELAEEVEIEPGWRERCVGLINDDRTPVGSVHLGIVHVLDLASPRARRREAALEGDGFAPLDALRRDRAAFETWSQFLLDGDALDEGHSG
jgi:predicted NUDIX family phosphoesterase